MSFGISNLSEQRLDVIQNAKTVEEATTMTFFDGLIDTYWRGGAKRDAIISLFEIVKGNADDTPTQLRALLDLRSLMVPEHRESLQLQVGTDVNGAYTFSISLDDRILFEREKVTDPEAIAMLEHAKNAIKVDEFLMAVQGFDPHAASLVQRSDRFLVEQGQVGDCYLIASMIGIMANPAMQEKIESMASVTPEGKLRLNFDANMTAVLTPNLRFGSLSDIKAETLENIVANDEVVATLRDKGYDLSVENGQLRLDLSEERLKIIIGTVKTAETNSLVVNILEHFVGNLMRYEVRLTEQEAPASNGAAKAAPVKLSELRSDRNSILVHNHRGGNYSYLVTNLLGYKTAGVHTIGSAEDAKSAQNLKQFLDKAQKEQRCLAQGGAKGFVYVGMAYGQTDAFGKIHGRHALSLHDVVRDDKGEILGVNLLNPWGNKRTPEYFSIDELIGRRGNLIKFTPPVAPVERQPSSGSAQKAFELFDAFA